MKGVNLKKLGAIIGGAAILASSVAFAGLMYGNTELVNDNGQIVAKVVVGANAAASDGVAAANIAATLAKNAYVKKTLSAQVTGTPTAKGGNATCDVTDKAVTLEVYVPGLKGTETHQFEPLIAEDLDLKLDNRDTPTTEQLTKNNDLLDEKANPFQDQNGGSFNLDPGVGGTTYTAYVVDGSKFDVFSDYKVKSAKFGIEATEYQKLYLNGYTARDDDEIYLDGNSVVYQIVFGPQDEGLPLCPGDTSKALGECEDANSIGSARYMIKFLGSTWVISGVEYSGATNVHDGDGDGQDDSETVGYPTADGAFTLKLAKEAKYGILHIRQYLETDDGYRIILKDISRNDWLGNPAIIEIKDANNNTVAEDQITPGHTKEISLPGDKKLSIHVYQTAPGYTLASAWAEIAVLSNEIRLEHGKKFLDYEGEDSDWYVHIGLVNKDADGTMTYSVDEQTHLKQILFVTDADAYDDVDEDVGGISEGKSLKILDLEDYQAFEVLNYGLEDAEMDTLSWEYSEHGIDKFETNIIVGNGVNVLYEDASDPDGAMINFAGPGDTVAIRYTEKLEIKSSDGEFEIGSYTGDKVYIYKGDLRNTDDTAPANYDDGDDALFVVIRDKDGNKYLVGYAYYDDSDNDDGDGTNDINDIADTVSFTYDWAGDDGEVTVSFDPGSVDSFELTENVGEIGGADTTDSLTVLVDWADGEFRTNLIDSATNDDVTFTYPGAVALNTYGYNNGQDYEVGKFVTLRGTIVNSDDGSKRTFKVPKSVRHLQLVVKPTEMAAEEMEMTEVGPLREGEEASVGDVKIKVKKIDVTTTAIAGGTIECSLEGVSAVITDGTATYENFTAYVPAEVPSDVVVLDTEAPDTGTVIAVGGPVVNSVTADLLAGSDVEITPDNPVVVKEIAQGKIVVAGYTAEDTLEAAKQFIAALQKV